VKQGKRDFTTEAQRAQRRKEEIFFKFLSVSIFNIFDLWWIGVVLEKGHVLVRLLRRTKT